MKRTARNAIAWKVFLAEHYDIGEKDSKTMRIATLFRKKPSDDNPAMWALLDEILWLAAEVLEKPENAHLSTHFSDRRSPQTSRLCYLLAAKEDAYVQKMLGKLKATVPETQTNTYMFDGAEVRVRPQDMASVQDALNTVSTELDIKFVIKPRPEVPDRE